MLLVPLGCPFLSPVVTCPVTMNDVPQRPHWLQPYMGTLTLALILTMNDLATLQVLRASSMDR
jgi:hypothetical protein